MVNGEKTILKEKLGFFFLEALECLINHYDSIGALEKTWALEMVNVNKYMEKIISGAFGLSQTLL